MTTRFNGFWGGVAPFIVSRLVGHASVAFTLARYGHWTQDHLDTARVATAGMYGEVRPRGEGSKVVALTGEYELVSDHA